jgi:ferredoxin
LLLLKWLFKTHPASLTLGTPPREGTEHDGLKNKFMKIVVDEEKCPKNHHCPLVESCPAGAISQQGFAAPVVDVEKCVTCGLCVNSCGYKAFGFSE